MNKDESESNYADRIIVSCPSHLQFDPSNIQQDPDKTSTIQRILKEDGGILCVCVCICLSAIVLLLKFDSIEFTNQTFPIPSRLNSPDYRAHSFLSIFPFGRLYLEQEMIFGCIWPAAV